MSISKPNLYDYYKRYNQWNEERIKMLYNNLKQEKPITIYVVSYKGIPEFFSKELQYCAKSIKPSEAFVDVIPEKKDDFILYFWKHIDSSLKIKDKNNEYDEFKNWFNDLLSKDADEENGLNMKNREKWFAVTNLELENNRLQTFEEFFNLLEEKQVL